MKLKISLLLFLLIPALKAAEGNQITIKFNESNPLIKNEQITEEIQQEIQKEPVFFFQNAFFNEPKYGDSRLYITAHSTALKLKDESQEKKINYTVKHQQSYTVLYKILYKNKEVTGADVTVQNFIKYTSVYLKLKKPNEIEADSTRREKYDELLNKKFYSLDDLKYILDESPKIENELPKIQSIIETGHYQNTFSLGCIFLAGVCLGSLPLAFSVGSKSNWATSEKIQCGVLVAILLGSGYWALSTK